MADFNQSEAMTRAQLVELCSLIDMKLRGDARTGLLDLARKKRLSRRVAQRHIDRLAEMPDREDGNAKAILRPEHIPAIRAARANGQTLRSLAAEYHVSHTTIADACTGKNWKGF